MSRGTERVNANTKRAHGSPKKTWQPLNTLSAPIIFSSLFEKEVTCTNRAYSASHLALASWTVSSCTC